MILDLICCNNTAMAAGWNATTTLSLKVGVHDQKTKQFYTHVMTIVGLTCTLLIAFVVALRYATRRNFPTAYSSQFRTAEESTTFQLLINLRRLQLLEHFRQARSEHLEENFVLFPSYQVRFGQSIESERCSVEMSSHQIGHLDDQPMTLSDPPGYNDLIICGIINDRPPDYETAVKDSGDFMETHNAVVSPASCDITIIDRIDEMHQPSCQTVTSETTILPVLCDLTTAIRIDETHQPCQTVASETIVLDGSVTEQVQACRDLIQQAIMTVDRINLQLLPAIVESHSDELSLTDI